jgi:hypothetical protein
MVTTLLVLIAVNLIGYLVVYLLLREKVRRASSAQAAVSEVREEVNRLIVELNQTADRNVALLEDRIAGLAELLSKADKKMGLLRRESEKHDMGAQVYGRIIDSRPEAPSRPGAPARPEAKARTAPEAPGEPDFMGAGRTEALDVRQQVIALHRAGFSASLIASRVGAPLGEVELIISLERRKGSA